MALTEAEQKKLSTILRDIEKVNQDLSAFQHLTLIQDVRQQLTQSASELKQLMDKGR
jgi:hypothetical protein